MPQSKSFLRSLRRKHRLGEFSRSKRISKRGRGKSTSNRRTAPRRTYRRSGPQKNINSISGFLPNGKDLSGMRTETYMRSIAERGSSGLGTDMS